MVLCFLKDVVNHSWQVVSSHEFKVHMIPIRRISFFGSREVIASIVTHPDIKASPCKDKSGSFILGIDYPLGGDIFDTVLEKHDWGFLLSIFGRNTMQCEFVTIISSDLVFLKRETLFQNDLLDALESIIILRVSFSFFGGEVSTK